MTAEPDVSLADRLQARIDADGPLAVSAYVEAALYDEQAGFYASQGQAGRRGDFLTAPEVGPLFGAVLARALDTWWDDLGRPEPFTVHEWGAGPGTLARTVLAAAPEVLTSGALDWVMLERSAPQRAQHPAHPQFRSVASLDVPDDSIVGVVLANELLDNLPFDMVERTADGWAPLAIGPMDADGRFTLVEAIQERDPVAAVGPDDGQAAPLGTGLPAGWDDGIAPGTRLPAQTQAADWVRSALVALRRGRLLVFDYGAALVELAERDGGWLRTHRSHDGRADWLAAPGSCDITADVAVDALQAATEPAMVTRQDEWLRRHGIDDLVEEGRRLWEATAGVGDLAALKARSRVREAEALCDPSGMGAFLAMEWVVPGQPG